MCVRYKSILLMCILLLGNCGRSKKQEFTVFYLCGPVEFISEIDCSRLERICAKTEYNDTVFIDSDMAEQVKDAIMNANSYNAKMAAKKIESDLILSRRIYINMGNIDLCLNQYGNLCWIQENNKGYHSSVLNDKISYYLKWKSLYYSFFDNSYFESDTEIQRYGYPVYNDEEKDHDPKWIEGCSYKVLIKER